MTKYKNGKILNMPIKTFFTAFQLQIPTFLYFHISIDMSTTKFAY